MQLINGECVCFCLILTPLTGALMFCHLTSSGQIQQHHLQTLTQSQHLKIQCDTLCFGL